MLILAERSPRGVALEPGFVNWSRIRCTPRFSGGRRSTHTYDDTSAI